MSGVAKEDLGQLQNDPEKSGPSTKNHRSNMPPESAFTYGLINKSPSLGGIEEQTWCARTFVICMCRPPRMPDFDLAAARSDGQGWP